MKRTIIIAASAVTLAAARHCRFAISVRPVSECAAPGGNGIGNPARKIRRQRQEKRRRQPSCKGGNCPPHFFHSDTGSRHDSRLCHPPLRFGRYSRREDCRPTPRTTSLKSTSPGQFRRTPRLAVLRAAGCGSLRSRSQEHQRPSGHRRLYGHGIRRLDPCPRGDSPGLAACRCQPHTFHGFRRQELFGTQPACRNGIGTRAGTYAVTNSGSLWRPGLCARLRP